MHWTRGPAAGFTRGTPWEPLQPDSLTANVEAQDADPKSLLNLYRRLIHRRAQHPALGAGEVVPLVASSDAVAAYLRRDGRSEDRDGRVVLVVANLGTALLSGVALSSDKPVLPAGRYATRNLLGGRSATPLTVGADGHIHGYVPVPSLGAKKSHLLELSLATR